MLNQALAIIHDEHRAIGAVLHGLRHVAQAAQSSGKAPDYPLLWAMLSYIDHFSERLHHPKEEHYVFVCLAKRTREGDSVIATLRQQHRDGEQWIRDLERTLGDCEGSGNHAMASFISRLDAFAAEAWKHMALEESDLLPLAKHFLTAGDWVEIALAFGRNGDPRFGEEQNREFRDIYRRIVNAAPPPVGLGPLLGSRANGMQSGTG